MSKGICHDARFKHQVKVQGFSNEQPHVTLPLFPNDNAGSLFDLVQETQIEQFSSAWRVFRHPVFLLSFTSSRPSLNLVTQRHSTFS
jgi:hypothetical protein